MLSTLRLIGASSWRPGGPGRAWLRHMMSKPGLTLETQFHPHYSTRTFIDLFPSLTPLDT